MGLTVNLGRRPGSRSRSGSRAGCARCRTWQSPDGRSATGEAATPTGEQREDPADPADPEDPAGGLRALAAMLGVSRVAGLIHASVGVASAVYQSVVDAIELGRQQQLAVADVVSDWAFAVAFVSLAMDQRRLLAAAKGDTDSDTESEASEASAHPAEAVHSKLQLATHSGVQRLRQLKMRYRAASTGEQVRRASSCDSEPPANAPEAGGRAAAEPETQHAKHSGVSILRSLGTRYSRAASAGEERQQGQQEQHQQEQAEHEGSHRPPTPSPPPTPKGPGLFRQLKTRYRSSSACEPVRRPSSSEAEQAAPVEAHALLTPSNAAHAVKESGMQRLRRLGRYRASSACDPAQQQQHDYSDSSDDDSSDDEDSAGNNQLVPKLSRAQRLRQMRMKYRASSAEMARKFTDIVASEARDAAVHVGSRLSVTREAAAHVGARLSVTRDAAAHVGARLSMFAVRTKSSSTDFDSPDLPETPRGDIMPPTPTTPTTPMPPTPTTPTTPTEMWEGGENDEVEGQMPPTPTTPTTPNAIWEGDEEEEEEEDDDIDGPRPPTPTTPTEGAEMWSADNNDDDEDLPPTPTTPTEETGMWGEGSNGGDEDLPPSPTTPKELWADNDKQEEPELESEHATLATEDKVKVESPTATQASMLP